MRVAVLADIHANERALSAVLEATTAADVARIVVLGDLVGYGARPAEVLELVRARADVTVLGNHDYAVTHRPAAGTREEARRAVDWTREQLQPSDLRFLASIEPIVADQESGLLCVHGCWLNPDHHYGYVTSTMLQDNLDAIARHPSGLRVGVCGHTHVPMVAFEQPAGTTELAVGDAVLTWPPVARAVLINPGSVGQPRDGDPRASFALVDADARTAQLVRVAYDVEETVRQIEAAGLPAANAERLREGR